MEESMPEGTEEKLIPEQIRRALSLIISIIAAILYAGILGNAVLRSALEEDPVFSENMLRAASFLSGLVGSVVTAGFAKSQQPVSVQMSNNHPMGGRTLTAWYSLRPPSLVRRNLLGLATAIGLYPANRPLPRSQPPQAEAPEASDSLSAVVWIALLYFAVYFLVGIGAFFVTIWRDGAPEIVVNSGWVWLGTVISSAYSFLGLNAGQ
jgi:hypothetical protein